MQAYTKFSINILFNTCTSPSIYISSASLKQLKITKVTKYIIREFTKMAGGKWSILVALFILLISMEAAIAQGQGNGNGNGNNGNGNNGNGKGKDKEEGKEKGKEKEKAPKKKKAPKEESSNYQQLQTLPSGQERAFCKANNTCHFATLVCPAECKTRKPKKNKKDKGCFIDCSSKCEATCKCKFTSIFTYFYSIIFNFDSPHSSNHTVVNI